jgi:hypothetical protein
VDVIRQRRDQSLTGETLGNAEHSKEENERDANDNQKSIEEILGHMKRVSVASCRWSI